MKVAFSATIVQLKYAVKPYTESFVFFPLNLYYDVICVAKINFLNRLIPAPIIRIIT